MKAKTNPAPRLAGTAEIGRKVLVLAKALEQIRQHNPATFWAISSVILEVEKKSTKDLTPKIW